MRPSVVEPISPTAVNLPGQRKRPPHRPRMSQSRQAQRPSRWLPFIAAPAEGWFALLCLAVAAYCVIYSITAVKWVNHTFILDWSAACGLLIGLGVAKTRRFPQGIIHLAACLVGYWLSIWLSSSIAFHVSWTTLTAGIGEVVTDPTRINNNTMVFLFYLCFLCFFLGYFGAWLTYRAHLPWLVAIVYCSILLINLNYVRQDASSIITLMLAALILLIARIQLTAQLAHWQSMGLHTDRAWLRGITRRTIQLSAFMLVFTLISGWILPILAQPPAGTTFWGKLDNAWANISQGHVSLQDPGALLQPYQAPTNLFSDKLTISGSVHLPAGEVLNYTSSAGPQYLAGFTYDHFDGHAWTSLASTSYQNYAADTSLPTDINLKYTPINTSVTLVQPPESVRHYIFAPTQPASFDISTTLYGDQMTSAWAQESTLTKREHYQVTSLLSTASVHDLATVPLPQADAGFWQTDPNYSTLQSFYVQLPHDLSPQVWQTTQQWTRGATSAFDALRLLEAHLSDQAQFVYSLDNPPVPGNIDAVSWLLQTRHGYCTYYATAMTTMARQLHIPARVVNGFTRGHLDQQRNVWVVDGSDAHSWVQVYFPAFGWINFDPTPGFPLHTSSTLQPVVPAAATVHPKQPPVRVTPTPGSKKAQPVPAAASQRRDDPSGQATNSLLNFLLGLSLATLICSLLVLAIASARYWWLNLYPGSTFIAGTFWRLCRLASWAGLAPQAWQTPYEFSHLLCQRLPRDAPPVWRLTELFVRERWAPQATPYALRSGEVEAEKLKPSLHRIFVRLLWTKNRLKKHC